MKVLFAVNNEEISESIVKRYQKEYKEIISYKNVYYFNAILKELQKDKNYDRIVISEELEAFTHTQFEQIDKFIFDKLDGISDEASNLKGEDIPIILICADRREKSEQMLVKLFGIGIYDALIGNDRSVEKVCQLLNKPRSKKEAKIYYNIDSEDVTYQAENENDVSEVEIQNILAHYKRLGKDENKYVESFNNIASQYNDIQLKIISKFLPLNVRAVLEEKSQKYQQIMAFNSKVSDSLRGDRVPSKREIEGTSEKLLKSSKKEVVLSRPVVVPSSVNMNSAKKLSRNKPEVQTEQEIQHTIQGTQNVKEAQIIQNVQTIGKETNRIPNAQQVQANEQKIEETVVAPKRRGRPRKNPLPEENINIAPATQKRRGRPRKNPLPEDNFDAVILPGFNNEENEQSLNNQNNFNNMNDLSNQDSINSQNSYNNQHDEGMILPGLNDIPNDEEPTILPGFEEDTVNTSGFSGIEQNTTSKVEEVTTLPGLENYQEDNQSYYEDIDITSLLTSDKKVACFIGTSKNGTSFIINNIAQITSQNGIDTAIFDTTKNRNSYYIYTKNEEQLRQTAMHSINNLLNGTAQGIQANKNLTIYTSLPDEAPGMENAGKILETLVKKHSLILIDCDYDTPIKYFEKAQEIYLVQTYDILTIQPLTAFLRELKSRNIIEESKLKIVLNKSEKLRGVNEKTIIGGMSRYNDPSMSFMVDLFDKNTIKYISVPFDEEVYIRYLQSVIDCEVSIKGYPKNMIQIFNALANMVYPVHSNKSGYVPPKVQNNSFSSSMNSTLDQMKRKY